MNEALLGVTLAVSATLAEGVAQLLLKLATLHPGRKWTWTVAALALFGVESGIYTLALAHLAVNIAYPIGALSFVFVTLLSRLILRERIGPARWQGLILIMLGAVLVASRA
ncbi:4-amino-4-deoxy-L-arabinose-phosphoundecaprenol flippase subunit ArnE [mine drainage metagenome]|uniref:4-amino-4-deoxy-L-arabinose-phosphoundecaprenol flippase subunit ArnE n=1 Tax=mine drainage metagenome TaxID=410659 RepID=A0A1J5S4U9_9ZZZZ